MFAYYLRLALASFRRNPGLTALMVLAIALALAVVLAQPKVKALEQRFGVTVLISAGVPFLAMGAIFSLENTQAHQP